MPIGQLMLFHITRDRIGIQIGFVLLVVQADQGVGHAARCDALQQTVAPSVEEFRDVFYLDLRQALIHREALPACRAHRHRRQSFVVAGEATSLLHEVHVGLLDDGQAAFHSRLNGVILAHELQSSGCRRIALGTGLDQEIDDRCVGAKPGHVERSLAGQILRIDVGAAIEQQFYGIKAHEVRIGCKHERRAAPFVGRIYARSAIDGKFEVARAGHDGHVEQRGGPYLLVETRSHELEAGLAIGFDGGAQAGGAHGFDVCTMVDEHAHHLRVAGDSGLAQRSGIAGRASAGIRFGAVIQKILHDRSAAGLCGGDEQRRAAVVRARVHLSAMLHQNTYLGQIADRPHQSGGIGIIDRVWIAAPGPQPFEQRRIAIERGEHERRRASRPAQVERFRIFAGQRLKRGQVSVPQNVHHSHGQRIRGGQIGLARYIVRPFGALIDPSPEHVDRFRAEGSGGRHLETKLSSNQAQIQTARRRVARRDHLDRATAKSDAAPVQPEGIHLLRGAMATDAVLLDQRHHVAAKIDTAFGGSSQISGQQTGSENRGNTNPEHSGPPGRAESARRGA